MCRCWASQRVAEGAAEEAAEEKVEEGSAGSTGRSSGRSMVAAAMPRCILATSRPEMGTAHAHYSHIKYLHSRRAALRIRTEHWRYIDRLNLLLGQKL